MLLDNVQVSIRRVHIRYEAIGAAGPLSLGVKIDELNAYNCDAAWNQAFSKDLTRRFKLFNISMCQVYWNCNEVAESAGSKACEAAVPEFIEAMTSHQHVDTHLLQPVSAELKSTLTRGGAHGTGNMAQLVFELNVSEVSLQLSAPQYRDILFLMSSFSAFRRRAPHAELRPMIAVLANAKEWWRYAIQSLTLTLTLTLTQGMVAVCNSECDCR